MDCRSGSSSMDFDYDSFSLLNDTAFNASQCNCSISAHANRDECECDYDYADSLPATLSEFLPLGIIYGVVFLLGTIGNGLVIFVVAQYKRMQSVTNVFLASLSTADMCLILFCVPIQYVKYLSYTWVIGKLCCYLLHYVQGFTMFCSVLTLTAMSVERFIAIVHPMRTVGLHSVGRARKIVILLWFVALFLAVPNAIGTDFEEIETQRNKTAYWCRKNTNVEFAQWFSVYQFALVLTLPSITMIFCYANITRVLYFGNAQIETEPRLPRGAVVLVKAATDTIASDSPLVKVRTTTEKREKRLLRKSAKASSESQTKKQVTQMLILVVVLFVICWSPYVLDDFLTAFGVLCGESVTATLKYMRMVFAIMAYSNSCVNPVVYAFMSKNFRQTFKLSYKRLLLPRDQFHREFGASTAPSRRSSGNPGQNHPNNAGASQMSNVRTEYSRKSSAGSVRQSFDDA